MSPVLCTVDFNLHALQSDLQAIDAVMFDLERIMGESTVCVCDMQCYSRYTTVVLFHALHSIVHFCSLAETAQHLDYVHPTFHVSTAYNL